MLAFLPKFPNLTNFESIMLIVVMKYIVTKIKIKFYLYQTICKILVFSTKSDIDEFLAHYYSALPTHYQTPHGREPHHILFVLMEVCNRNAGKIIMKSKPLVQFD